MTAIFYGKGWIFGQGVAVQEQGHEPAGTLAAANLAAGLGAAKNTAANAQLQTRLQTADVVVVGKVTTIQRIALRAGLRATMGGKVTEHDPNWQDAVIEVQSSLKGVQSGGNIVVRFPASIDVAWYRAPKLFIGEAGVFILKRDQLSGSPEALLNGATVPAYVVTNPNDVLSEAELDRVRSLMPR
jgi:hypothetical protein